MCWDIVGLDVGAVQEFFANGPLLKQVNATMICLLPKEDNLTFIRDFRPISLCNTTPKLILKVPGRSIFHNSAIVQELMNRYERMCLLVA